MTGRENATKMIRGACPHDCPDTCAWEIKVDNGTTVELVGDRNHPFTRGGLCAKVNHYLERVYSPDRVLHPLRRTGPKGKGEFERVSWDEALSAISKRLKRIIDEDGPTAILPYSYMGTQGLIQKEAGTPFFARLGATRLVRAICGAAGGSGISATMGSGSGMLPEEIVHSKLIIFWGTNTVVTDLHYWPFIQQARKQGATVVVIDPLKTRTASLAGWHIRPLPGTDAALALGMMNVIIEEDLYDADFVKDYTIGFDQLRVQVADYPPARVAELTGVPQEEIVNLARAYATRQPAAIRTLIGMEHHRNGAMIFRAIACLPALVGAWKHRGGGIPAAWSFHFEAINAAAVEMPELEDQAIRSVNMVQLGQALVHMEPEPPIRSLIVYSSNPAAIAPNQNLVLAGLRREDLLTVVHEQFMTDTARHADFVLPATTQIEQLDLMWSWGHTYLALNMPAIHPVGEAVSNTEFFRRLATWMDLDEPYLHTTDEARIRAVLNSDHAFLAGITYEKLQEEGWAPLKIPDDWRPFAQGAFPTPSGKCEFYSQSWADVGMDPLPAHIPLNASLAGARESASPYPLQLITSKSAVHFLNSSYANLPRHLRSEGEPVLQLSSEDAAQRGIKDGERVLVFNDRGRVTLPARIGDIVHSGVVAMPSGWWASLSLGGSSANALTADGLSDMGGGADFHDTWVQVTNVKSC